MLRYLSIRRLAVIDAAEVEFQPGLNVLTGETGAGKSILVEAVGLLLGGRASGALVRARGGGVATTGRRPAAVPCKEWSGRLMKLHGQPEHQRLRDPSTHLDVVDTF